MCQSQKEVGCILLEGGILEGFKLPRRKFKRLSNSAKRLLRTNFAKFLKRDRNTDRLRVLQKSFGSWQKLFPNLNRLSGDSAI